MSTASDPPAAVPSVGAPGENFTLPPSAVAEVACFAPAWILFAPPAVEIVCVAVSAAEM